MAVHWTDFPERVETFGDLFGIFETFENDVRADLIHSGSCEKETDQSAYTAEFVGGARIIPRPDRIAGWDRLATYAEREFHDSPSLYILRSVRGLTSDVLDLPIAAINGMIIAQVVEALEDADRESVPEDAGADFLLAEYRWLKVTQIAKLFAMPAGQVSKFATAGTFVTNGKTEHDRRIDVLSVVCYELDRLNRAGNSGT